MQVIKYYKYKIIENNKIIAGQLYAKNKDDLIKMLNVSTKNIVCVKTRFEFFQKPSFTNLKIFSQILYKYLCAGLNISDAMIEIQKYKISQLDQVINGMIVNIQNGMMFSDAVKINAHIFPMTFIILLQIGEKVGNIKFALHEATEYFKNMEKLSNEVKKTLRYPKILFIVLIGAMIVMKFTVIDNVVNFMSSLDIEIPFTTQIIVNIFQSPEKIIFGIVLFFILKIIISMYTRKNDKLKVKIDKIILCMPYVGDFIKTKFLFNFNFDMYILLKNSVNLIDSIKICNDIPSNFYIKYILKDIESRIINGSNFCKSMENHSIFPTIMIKIVGIGETSGMLSESFQELSDLYYENFVQKQDLIIKLIEPSMLVIMGAVVVFVMFGTLIPIYSAMSSLVL